ncbi:uncharacterized protein LOC122015398 [Zingiber officinale]|uniref:Uncharacterized protein n=1 Tax=Zingiber officinale TaxID=94328 RepID=A0A8J5FA80_ZINOF|nr:uncharacterized protein LOC122015398 [Zingiber officinale]KAG6482758.1 hypothetical protein ZIOFF_059396 [Zingiber officinale]
MKCKIHSYEEGVGVCASCLRERLLALVASRSEISDTHAHRRRGSDAPPPPPPLVVPRSVSPYVSSRRSVDFDGSSGHPLRLQPFFNTPQVGPFLNASGGRGGFGEVGDGRRRGFSVLRTLFGRRRRGEADPGLGALKASASGSWFSSLTWYREKKNKGAQLSSAAEEQSPRGRAPGSSGAVEMVISPAVDGGDDYHTSPRSEMCREHWRRPTPTPMREFLGSKRQPRSFSPVSGFSVCLSPLVRLSPHSRRRQAADMGTAGDLRSAAGSVHHQNRAVGGATLGRNRSRNVGSFK